MQILDHIRSLQRLHKNQSWIRICAQKITKLREKKLNRSYGWKFKNLCQRHVHNKHTYQTKPKYLTEENLRYK